VLIQRRKLGVLRQHVPDLWGGDASGLGGQADAARAAQLLKELGLGLVGQLRGLLVYLPEDGIPCRSEGPVLLAGAA